MKDTLELVSFCEVDNQQTNCLILSMFKKKKTKIMGYDAPLQKCKQPVRGKHTHTQKTES